MELGGEVLGEVYAENVEMHKEDVESSSTDQVFQMLWQQHTIVIFHGALLSVSAGVAHDEHSILFVVVTQKGKRLEAP